MAVKVGYKLLLTFLQLASFSFVDCKYECAFSGKEFITFNKDIVDGPLPCQYTLLRTNAHDHIDSFLIETFCNQRKETYEKSISVTALGKHILLNMYNITIDQIPQRKDVSIMIPPVRIDVTQTKGIKRVHLNIGITVLYTPPNTVKIVIGANYTGTHNLTGACGNPWATAKHPGNHNVNRRRLFNLIKNNPKYPQKHDSSNWAKVKPEFKRIPNSAYNNMNRPSILGQQNGVRYPQHISNKAGDRRFQKATIFPRCYFGGFVHHNGSMWMSIDCLVVFTCVNTLVTHRKSSGCSEFADCVKIQQGATCRCRPGFIGTGLTCAFLQDKVAPHAPNGNFGTVITPAVPAGRLVTTVGLDIKKGPSYSDWRNLIRQPLNNRPWRPQNRNDFKKKFHENKIWRPLKRGPMLNADKPGRQLPSVRLGGFPGFSKNGLNPMARNRLNVDEPRQRFKNVPSHHIASRARLGKPKNRYRTGPNLFTLLNNPNRSRKVGKPQITDNRHFNRHPLTLDKNRVIPDTMPHNKLGLYPALANKPRQIYMSCKRKNGRNICKLMPGTYKNGKTVPDADLFNINPGLRKRLIIFINNKFRPHKKPKPNPVESPNNRDRIMDNSMPEHGRRHPRRRPKPDHFPDKGTGNNEHKNKNPTTRTHNSPKLNDSSHNRPIEKDHKLTNLNQYPHKQPEPSDIKRVTEILRRVSVALNETGKKRVSTSRWVVLPRSSTLFTSPSTGRHMFTNFGATFTPPTTRFVNPTPKNKGDDRFTTTLLTSTSNIETLAEYTYSPEQPQLGANRRPLLNDGGGVSGVQRGAVKNNPRQNNVKHKYPTADGTVDGLVIDPPPEWPFQFPGSHNGYRNQKGIQRPNTGPRANPGIRKCSAAGCGKRKNATNKGHTFLPRKYVEFVYPSSIRSLNNPSDAVSTLATSVLYTTQKATTPEIRVEPVKEDRRVNSNFEQSKTNPKVAGKNVEPQPPSGAEVHANSDNCKQTKERTPLSGLRYNILKQIRQSVEEIEG